MYLSLKEIWHEKLRYGLIIGMILLVTYLVFILSALANGLAQQNTQAIEVLGHIEGGIGKGLGYQFEPVAADVRADKSD